MTKADYYEVVDSLAVLNWVAQQPDLHDFYAQKIRESIEKIHNALPTAQMTKVQERWDQLGKRPVSGELGDESYDTVASRILDEQRHATPDMFEGA